jgi:2'-5' RNA ligase
LFVALTLPETTRLGLERWQRTQIGDRPGVRLVGAPQLHITLVFLGNRPAAEVDRIAAAVRQHGVGPSPSFDVVGYRETRHVGMVPLRESPARGGKPATRAQELATGLMHVLADLGVYRLEVRAWLPHVTVARFKTRPGLAPEPPALQPFRANEVVLYESRPGPRGSIYVPLESVALVD